MRSVYLMIITALVTSCGENDVQTYQIPKSPKETVAAEERMPEPAEAAYSDHTFSCAPPSGWRKNRQPACEWQRMQLKTLPLTSIWSYCVWEMFPTM